MGITLICEGIYDEQTNLLIKTFKKNNERLTRKCVHRTRVPPHSTVFNLVTLGQLYFGLHVPQVEN
jgi:hypothetical protein